MKKIFFICLLSCCFVSQISQASTGNCETTFIKNTQNEIAAVKVYIPAYGGATKFRNELIDILKLSHAKKYNVLVAFHFGLMFAENNTAVFIEKVFGGLVREGQQTKKEYLQKEYLDKHFLIATEKSFPRDYERLAYRYMKEAEAEAEAEQLKKAEAEQLKKAEAEQWKKAKAELLKKAEAEQLKKADPVIRFPW